jgi:transcriptional regulator with GAF, ATPase, and Fis domain
MPTHHLQQLSRLRGFLEVTRLVRSEDELDDLLAAIARAISTSLGYATVVVHLYRPAWDDFVVTTVHGGDAAREQLMGDTRPATMWEALLDERFEAGGAYLIPHGEFDWATYAPGSYVPETEPRADDDAWHPEDALFVPLRHSDGHLIGILWWTSPRRASCRATRSSRCSWRWPTTRRSPSRAPRRHRPPPATGPRSSSCWPCRRGSPRPSRSTRS